MVGYSGLAIWCRCQLEPPAGQLAARQWAPGLLSLSVTQRRSRHRRPKRLFGLAQGVEGSSPLPAGGLGRVVAGRPSRAPNQVDLPATRSITLRDGHISFANIKARTQASKPWQITSWFAPLDLAGKMFLRQTLRYQHYVACASFQRLLERLFQSLKVKMISSVYD